jgi:hypothetical protein
MLLSVIRSDKLTPPSETSCSCSERVFGAINVGYRNLDRDSFATRPDMAIEQPDSRQEMRRLNE